MTTVYLAPNRIVPPRFHRPRGARPKPKRRFPAEVLTAEEVGRLIKAADHGFLTSARNKALIAVLYRSGLRITEALDLYPKDIDAAAGAIRVLHGKGDRSRVVGIDSGGLAYVKAWMERRARLRLNGCHPVFCTTRGERLAAAYVRRLFRLVGVKAGIHKRVHPHGLRHTHAAELRTEGIDVGVISKQLGHRSIATTAHYLDHIAPTSVIEAVRSRSDWVASG